MSESTEVELKDKIIAVLKAEGLEVTEEAVKAFIPIIMKIVKVIVEDSKTTWDDALFGMLGGKLEEIVLALAEKINKED